MNWEVIGALGEWAGAIVVVITLFFLSRQIAQQSKALDRSNDFASTNSVHNTNALFASFFEKLADNAELASIYHRALNGDELTPVESVRFKALINVFFAFLEDIHIQIGFKVGFDEFIEYERDELFAHALPYWNRLLSTKYGEEWWQDEAPYLYSNEFYTAICEARAKHGSV